MWKQLVLIAVLIGALALPAAATAQGGTFRVWQTLGSQDSEAITALVEQFTARSGADFELVYIDGPFLLDSMLQATSAGNSPDVIFSNNGNAAPLAQSGLLATSVVSDQFFLEDLLGAFPDLALDLCGKNAIQDCLWPDAGAVFPVVTPQARTISVATSALCKASPWLPLCDASPLTMAPIGWDFDLYLIDSAWMAENGIDNPVSANEVLDLRSHYAIRFTAAREGAIPTVDEANRPAVFVLSSTLLSTDPNAVMESLATFYAEDYVPVVGLNIYGIYISDTAQNPEQAHEFATTIMDAREAKISLMAESGRVPAFSTAELMVLDRDDPIVTYTMQSLALLTTFTAY